MSICPVCKEEQFSLVDKKYLEVNGHCWCCDKKLVAIGALTLEEFEKREKLALGKVVVEGINNG